MGRLSRQGREDVRARLDGLSAGAKRIAVEDLAQEYQVSTATIYRAVRTSVSPRRRRAAQKPLAPEVRDYMLGLTVQADMSAQMVLELAGIKFGLPSDFCSVSTYNRVLRAQRVSRREMKRDLKPYHPFEAARPNLLHQYDTTVAAAWFERDSGAIGFEPEEQRYKNRQGNKKPRLHVYSLIDDHSRVLWAKIYRSENRHNLLRFFEWAWSKSDDKRWPAYGLPETMYADRGSPLEAKRTRAGLKKLGVEVIPTPSSYSTKHGARKHGKVERTFGSGILGEWQKITRVQQFASLEELNTALYEWLIRRNAMRRHSATGERPFDRWLAGHITPRTAPDPEVWEEMHYDSDTRQVSPRLTVSVGGNEFQLPFRQPCVGWVGQKVEVFYRRDMEMENVTVCQGGDEIEAPLFGAQDITPAGTYKAIPKTEQEKTVEHAEAQRYGEARPDRADTPPFIQKPAAPPEVTDSRHTQEAQLTRFEVLALLRSVGIIGTGRLTADDTELLATAMGGAETVAKSQVQRAIALLLDSALKKSEGNA